MISSITKSVLKTNSYLLLSFIIAKGAVAAHSNTSQETLVSVAAPSDQHCSSDGSPVPVDANGKTQCQATEPKRSLTFNGGTFNGGTIVGSDKKQGNPATFNNTTFEGVTIVGRGGDGPAFNHCTFNGCTVVEGNVEGKSNQVSQGAASGARQPSHNQDTLMSHRSDNGTQAPSVGGEHLEYNPSVETQRAKGSSASITNVDFGGDQSSHNPEHMAKNRENAQNLDNWLNANHPGLTRPHIDHAALEPRKDSGSGPTILMDPQMGWLSIKDGKIYDRANNYLGVLKSDPTAGTEKGGGQRSSGELFLYFDKPYVLNGKEIFSQGYVKSLHSGYVYDDKGDFWGKVVSDGAFFNNKFSLLKSGTPVIR